MVQRILSSEYKMDALVSIYYYAPICALLNFLVACVFEIPSVTMEEVYHVGIPVFAVNGMIAFLLNFAAVSLVSYPFSTFAPYSSSRFASAPNTRYPSQIGKTSAVVLTLCGVLKDILLVAASMLIWGTRVGPLQAFGYSISLAGIVYYKLGAATVLNLLSDTNRKWNRMPLVRRIVLVGGTFATVYLLFRQLGSPASPLDQDLGMDNSNERILDEAGI